MPYDISINTVIGEGTLVKGEIDIHGQLRIDGGVSGNIFSQGKVIVGKNGKVEGELFAKLVTVGGIVKGNIYADNKVELLKTAQIYGNIYTCSINVLDGVVFDGECKVLTPAELLDIISMKKKELAL